MNHIRGVGDEFGTDRGEVYCSTDEEVMMVKAFWGHFYWGHLLKGVKSKLLPRNRL